jgi:hypothetical protein
MSAGWYMMSAETGQKVTAMQPDPQPDDARAAGELLHPSYWLVYGLPWQGDSDLAEAAAAIAPGMIPHEPLSRDASQILGCADLHARKHRSPIVFFSDLTRMFTTAGTSWEQLGINWESALQELRDGQFPSLLLTVSERAYIVICNAATRLLLAGPDGEEEATAAECQLVRQAIASKLTADWPPYLQQTIDTGHIRLAG